jgi:hypothetical protein
VNRAQRRQRKLGRAPTVVAMPTIGRRRRFRTLTHAAAAACNLMTIDSGTPEDSRFVVKLMQDRFERTGSAPVLLDPSSPMLVVRHKLTGEPLGFASVKGIPPGKMYVENFLVVPGRKGKIAARALCERLLQFPAPKVTIVEAGNDAMLGVLEHYGFRVLGFLLEGPYRDGLPGAPEADAAAPPMENTA